MQEEEQLKHLFLWVTKWRQMLPPHYHWQPTKKKDIGWTEHQAFLWESSPPRSMEVPLQRATELSLQQMKVSEVSGNNNVLIILPNIAGLLAGKKNCRSKLLVTCNWVLPPVLLSRLAILWLSKWLKISTTEKELLDPSPALNRKCLQRHAAPSQVVWWCQDYKEALLTRSSIPKLSSCPWC